MMIDEKEDTNRLFLPTTNTHLYAFLLKLRPLQEGTLIPFNGELVHAAFLNWLRTAAPAVSEWLHEGNKRRLFTCSSLQWPLPRQRMLDAERGNVHMPLSPQLTYTVRITLLLGDLFPLFHKALMDFNMPTNNATQPPFMRIGRQLFLLEEVLLDNDAKSTNDDGPSAHWTGFISLGTLIEKAKALKLGRTESLTLEFDSLTTFNRGGTKNGEYGTFSATLPLPHYLFPNLAMRWVDIAPPELSNVIQKERIETYTLHDGIVIIDYALKPHVVKFTTHTQHGFLGTCKYLLRASDEAIADESPLTLRQQIHLLAQLAFYSGVGYKTSMGLGRTRPM